MRLCGFNLRGCVMSVCKGCYSIVKDVTFIVKGALTFLVSSMVFICCFSDRRAEGCDSGLGFFQCAEVVFMVEMFQDVPTRNIFRCKFWFTVGEEETIHFGTKSNKCLRCQTRTFVIRLAAVLGIGPRVEGVVDRIVGRVIRVHVVRPVFAQVGCLNVVDQRIGICCTCSKFPRNGICTS